MDEINQAKMCEISKALNYGSSLLHTKYLWWKDDDTNPDYIFYVNVVPSITDIRNKGVNCAGFINLVRQSTGRTMIEPAGEVGKICPGGTGYWYELLSSRNVLENYDKDKKYTKGTLLMRKYRNEIDQGHVAIVFNECQTVIHSYWDDCNNNGVDITKIIPDYYEYAIKPEDWLLCD